MQHTTQKLEKSQIKITITIPPAEYQKDLEKAAVTISERAAIKGFRPGKAPYEIVRKEVGEGRILEEALPGIVQRNFVTTLQAEKLKTVGSPEINLEKVAPHNDLVFSATVALLPEVTLPDIKTISVAREKKEIKKEDVDAMLTDLQKMQTKEIAKDGGATESDKVVVDLNMFIDNVPVDGGQTLNHQVYLNEPHYIPGLADQLVGLKKDDTKEFTLKFPKEHYQKHLANKNVDFKIKVKDVFSLEHPELNDDFAQSLRLENMEKLRELLTKNLANEAESKEDQRLEAAILEQIIEKTKFGVIPDVLIATEKRKMFAELKHDLERRGIEMEQYLKDVKKTEEEIVADFSEQAEKRAKAALVSHHLATEHKITVSKKDLDAEIEQIKAVYKNDQTVNENLERPEVLATIENTIRNRKVVEWLKEQVNPKP